jgi:hypothetical protein
MAESRTLQSIMNSEYKLAKRYYRCVLATQVLTFSAAMYALIASATSNTAILLVAFIGPLLILLFREMGGHYYSKGERIRRLNLLRDGLGIEVSEIDRLEILERASDQKPDGVPLGNYYTSDAPPGPQRLWHLLQESAYWTHAQARFAMMMHYTITSIGLIAAIVIAFLVLQTTATQSGRTAIDYSRLFSALILFFLTNATFATARSYHSLAKTANETFKHAGSLCKETSKNITEANHIMFYKVLGAYDSALAKAPPLPTYTYVRRQAQRNAAWANVREDVKATKQRTQSENEASKG